MRAFTLLFRFRITANILHIYELRKTGPESMQLQIESLVPHCCRQAAEGRAGLHGNSMFTALHLREGAPVVTQRLFFLAL
jgi:hypothetical protein